MKTQGVIQAAVVVWTSQRGPMTMVRWYNGPMVVRPGQKWALVGTQVTQSQETVERNGPGGFRGVEEQRKVSRILGVLWLI